MADSSTQYLSIGDYICLFYVKLSLNLCAEGILTDDVCVGEMANSFSDCLFQVQLQRQYSAASELDDFLQKHHDPLESKSDLGAEDAATKRFKNALEKGQENENKMNAHFFQQKLGAPVLFGDIIQLFHVKSGKYLTVAKSELAETEKENIRIFLSADGSADSWLQLLPRFKVDREGDRVAGNTEAFFRFADRNGIYLHVADRGKPDGNLREVNGALDTPTPWRINMFQRYEDTLNKDFLLGGQIVSFLDPEIKAYLTVLHRHETIEVVTNEESNARADAEAKIRKNKSRRKSTLSGEDISVAGGSVVSSAMSVSLEEGSSVDDGSVGSITSMDDFINTHGELVLTKMDRIKSEVLWILEKNPVSKGGIIKCKTDLLRLRHLNTGKCLLLDNFGRIDGEMGTRLKLIENPQGDVGFFSITELNTKVLVLHSGHPVNICSGDFFLERGDYVDDYRSYYVKMTKKKARATSLLITRYEEPPSAIKYAVAQPLETTVGLAVNRFFADAFSKILLPNFESKVIQSITIWKDPTSSIAKSFQDTVSRVIRYVSGFPICEGVIPVTLPLGIDSINARKFLLQEQGALNKVVRVLAALAPVSFYSVSDQFKGRIDGQDVLMQGNNIIISCVKLIAECVKNNNIGQLYIADYLMVLIAHSGSTALAGTLIRMLLEENLELQETKLSMREIDFFSSKIQERDVNTTYLELIQTCCICLGKGVTMNQFKVFKAISDLQVDVMIKSFIDNSSTSMPDAVLGDLNLYPIESGEEKAIGYNLVKNGVPEILLTWTSVSEEYSPKRLFSQDKVSAVNLFQSAGLRAEGLVSKRNDVGNFFVSQLNLMASICLDRNYSLMHHISAQYPVDLLLSLFILVENDALRGAAVRLLQNLYVDCDPQAKSIVPRLSRTWNDITSGQAYANDMGIKFSLLQQLISKTLSEYKDIPFGAAVFAISQLLQKLVDFNFYISIDKIKDVAGLLVKTLDRKEVVYVVEASIKQQLSRGFSVRQSRRMSTKDRAKMSAMKREKSQEALEIRNEEEVEVETWQRRLLNFTDSLHWLLVIMCVVFFAIGLASYQFISNDESIIWTICNYVVFAIFVAEFGIRAYVYHHCNGELQTFAANTYNQIDGVVIALDVIIFIVGAYIGSAGKFSKALRILRLARLVRLLRAARLVSKLIQTTLKIFPKWKMPLRYSSMPAIEIKTIVSILKSLRSFQNVLEDRYITMILENFKVWEAERNKPAGKSMLFVCDEIAENAVISDRTDDVLFDLLMYSDSEVVQSTLNVLMTHHTAVKVLLDNLDHVQLLVSSKREKQYQKLEKCLSHLHHDADTHSMWCKLLTEEDRRVNQDTMSNLKELLSLLRIRRQVLEFDEEFEPDISVQDMMRNLGCMDVCISFFKLVNTLGDDTLNESYKNSVKIIALCSDVFYWFIKGNPTNQELAYEYLDLFVNEIDRGCNFHKVISAIFHNNIPLMKLCPKKYIAEFVDKILNVGKFYQYLVLLAAVSPNVLEKQYEVIRQLSNPLHVKEILSYFVPLSSPVYQKKQKLMFTYLTKKDLPLEELPAELAYHVELLRVFAGCTIGRANMNSVEAKVQSLFNYRDVVMGILDPNALLIVKIRMLQFFYNAMIDVEMKLPNLGISKCIWLFVESTQEVFSTVKDLLRAIEKSGWESPAAHRQKVEYAVLCAKTIWCFFEAYFDKSVFKLQVQTASVGGFERCTLRENQIQDLIHNVFGKAREVYEMQSPLLSKEHHGYFFGALVAINTKLATPIVAEVKNLHEIALVHSGEAELRSQTSIPGRFNEFKKSIREDDRVAERVVDEQNHFLEKLEKMPLSSELTESDVRVDALFGKLVAHIRSSIHFTVIDSKIIANIDSQRTKTAIWIIKSWRLLIERKWGMTIYERDDDGGEEQDDACHDIMVMLNDCGATILCFDLIVGGIDNELQMEAINLLVGMLFHEGGNYAVQTRIYEHLSDSKSELFFARARDIFGDMIFWHQYRGVIELSEDEEPILPDEMILLRGMQLMCEGHYGLMQDIFRRQPNNHTQINFLDDMVNYFSALLSIPCRTSTTALLSLTALICEVIQGPCEGNQTHFALNTFLIEVMNKQLRAEGGKDSVLEQELELKKSCIDIFQALLEGQGQKKDVYDRVLSVVHIDIIFLMASPEAVESIENPSDDLLQIAQELRTESLVLLQMLCNYRPSIREELGIEEDAFKEDSTTTSVEVLWRGELQRRFFHIPDLCSYLAESSRTNFVLKVDRKLQENKLQGLQETARIFYMEMKHQEMLVSYGLSAIFSRTNQDRASMYCFILAFVVNLLMIIFYAAGDGTPHMSNAGNISVFVLNIILIVFATFSFVLLLIVRSPVIYETNYGNVQTKYEGSSSRELVLRAILMTTLDSSTMYSAIYLGFCIGGLFNQLLLSFLLLDVLTKSSYASEIVTAVANPARTLTAATIVMFICTYIVSFFVFMYFNNKDNFPFDYQDSGNAPHITACDTLSRCFKTYLRYGIPNVDIGNALTIGIRVFLDLIYFVLIFILLNIVKGIIINSFNELSEKTAEREEDTTEICFICGIPKVMFDRQIGRTAFEEHYKQEHNMWSYLYFIVYIWEQDKDDDDGLEQYVRRLIEKGEISWMPLGKSLMMQDLVGDASSSLDIVKDSFHADIRHLEAKLQKYIQSCEEHFKGIISKLHHHATRSGLEGSVVDTSTVGSLNDGTQKDSVIAISTGGTSVTEDTAIPAIKLVIKEILGLNTSRFSADENISCRVISGAIGNVDIISLRDQDVFYFEEEQLTVHRGNRNEDNLEKVAVRIQIFRVSILNNTNPTFVGAVDFSLQELDFNQVTLIEKEFMQNTTNSVCTLSAIIIPPSASTMSPQALRGVTRKTKILN